MISRTKLLRLVAMCTIVLAVSSLSSIAAPPKNYIALVTGSTGGTYYPVGTILATLWNDKLANMGVAASAQSSGGTTENPTDQEWRGRNGHRHDQPDVVQQLKGPRLSPAAQHRPARRNGLLARRHAVRSHQGIEDQHAAGYPRQTFLHRSDGSGPKHSSRAILRIVGGLADKDPS